MIRGAEASAVIYSITETALKNGLKPYNYLACVLDEMRKLPDFPSEEAIDDYAAKSEHAPKFVRSIQVAVQSRLIGDQRR